MALAAYPVVRGLTRRLERLQAGVDTLGAGNLAARVKVEGKDEVARLAESFNRAAARIEELMGAHRMLLANASHELRTPLSRIRLGIDLLQQTHDPKYQAALESDVAELDLMIDEILLTSRLGAVQKPQLEESIDLLALAAEEGARYDDCAVEGEALTVRGERRLLARLIRNLLDNASHHGMPPLRVVVRREATAPSLRSWTTARAFRKPSASGCFRRSIAWAEIPGAWALASLWSGRLRGSTAARRLSRRGRATRAASRSACRCRRHRHRDRLSGLTRPSAFSMVANMRIRISHETVYRYEEPARSVIQTLRLTPRNHEGQYVENWRIDVSENCQLDQHEDAFGNITHVFSAEGPFSELRVQVEGEVDTQDTAGIVKGAIERFPPSLYLRETPLTRADPAIAEFAQASLRAGDTPLSVVHNLLDRIHEEIVFDGDPTQATTTAAESFALKRGVCQDLTHIFIAAARSIAVPARYIGGHFQRNDGVTDQEAGHAWAEAYVPDFGWIAFDAANGICATDAHVRVAVGLDYLGAAPVRGTRFGGGGEALDVAVRVSEVGGGQRQSQS